MVNEKLKEFLLSKHQIYERNNYKPSVHSDKKFLTIFACHSNSELKFKTICNNFRYLNFLNNDIIIIDSINEKFSEKTKETLSAHTVKYYTVENKPTVDIGKWFYVLNDFDCSTYDYVVFTNDSIYITNPIMHYYNTMIKRNYELYGYNDSTQNNYHFQSFLFSIKTSALYKFINYYEKNKHRINSQEDCINLIELKLTEIYKNSCDCFLKIGKLNCNRGKTFFLTMMNYTKNY